MTIQELQLMVEKIKADDSATFEISPRMLMSAFGCQKRTIHNVRIVETYLTKHKLKVEPHFTEGWIDSTIVLKHKEKATTKADGDPVRKLTVLKAANQPPITITNSATLQEAVTIMMLHDYSQLPVMQNERKIHGYISWESIGTALAQNNLSDKISDYVCKNVKVLSPDTPLLAAVKDVYEHGFVVVVGQDEKLQGIVTTYDLSLEFITISEPFLLIEQIERQIRKILDGKFLVEELSRFSDQNSTKKIKSIDDLSFGEYIRLMENKDNWERLQLPIARKIFIEKLYLIREIRNDIMHFSPDELEEKQRNLLMQMAGFLTKLG
ncbi:MAG: CBS domain-containing protein [Bacteroidales bacterium]|nr:CBS domain-containing protein [Bacteroidales bacterium]